MNDDVLTEDRLRAGLQGIAEWGRPEQVPPLPAVAPAGAVEIGVPRASRLEKRTWWVAAAAIALVLGLVVANLGGGGGELPHANASWRSMASAPIEARAHPARVWTGNELVVIGGQAADGSWVRDGAAYDPESDTWRQLPDAPTDVRPGSPAVWTGREVIVFPGTFPQDVAKTPSSFAPRPPIALDLATGQWRELPDPRGGFSVAAVVVEQRVLLLTNDTRAEFSVLELVGDAWVEHITVPHAMTGDSWSWDSFAIERGALFVSLESRSPDAATVGFALELPEAAGGTTEGRRAAPRMTPIPRPPGTGSEIDAHAGFAAGHLVVSGRLSGDRPRSFTERYDLDGRNWVSGTAAFEDKTAARTSLWASVPGGVVVLGGTSSPWTDVRALRRIYDIAANEWRELPAPPIDLDRGGAVGVWTGDELVVWGGLAPRDGGGWAAAPLGALLTFATG
ncbi:MAG TPA: hypothetical protein VF230_00015 [Acidimicrobiales bacterium]